MLKRFPLPTPILNGHKKATKDIRKNNVLWPVLPFDAYCKWQVREGAHSVLGGGEGEWFSERYVFLAYCLFFKCKGTLPSLCKVNDSPGNLILFDSTCYFLEMRTK